MSDSPMTVIVESGHTQVTIVETQNTATANAPSQITVQGSETQVSVAEIATTVSVVTQTTVASISDDRVTVLSVGTQGAAGSGGVPDGNKGDITTLSEGPAWTINLQAVTLAKTSVGVQASLALADSAIQAGDLATVATSGSYNDLSNKPSIPSQYTDELAQDAVGGILADSAEIEFTYNDSTPSIAASIVNGSLSKTKLDASVNASLDLADSALQASAIGVSVQAYSSVLAATTASFTAAAESKLASIASGAEVNVNADWNAVSGDAQILNKPSLGTAATQNASAFATAAQGALADTAVQPAALSAYQPLATVLTNTTASFTSALAAKLSGIEDNATANSSDATLLDRANHTGAQAATTVTVSPSGNLSSTNAQNAFIELQGDIDTINSSLGGLTDAVVLKGSWDASAGTFPGSGVAKAGWSYIVSVGGTVDGTSFSVNDRLLAITNNASTSVFASNWMKLDYTDQVLSVNGQTGAVTLNTSHVSESTNLYFTAARAIASAITGFVSGAGTVSASDTIVEAFNKVVGNISALASTVSGLVTGVSSVFGRTGAVTAQSGDYNTSQVTESSNLYFTDERAQDAVGATFDSTLTYNDAGNSMGRAAITGDVTISAGSNTSAIASGVIVDADVNASAAIALSKLAATTASRAVVTDASGFLAAATTTSTEIGYVSGVTSAIQTQLNSKQATGNYITALTGDITASGPGNATATLPTVNANVGTFGSANGIPIVTVNGKGQVTGASTASVNITTANISDIASVAKTFLISPSSASLANAVTDETGSGALVFGTAPTFTTQITAPTVHGSASSGGSLTLSSTSHATKGNILFGSASVYDQVNNRFGIGITSPSTTLHVKSGRVTIDQTEGASGGAVLQFTNGTDWMYWFLSSVASGGVGHIRTDSARAIILQDAATSSGGIGVGGAPSEKLHVYGNILASGDVNASNVNVDNVLINGSFDICQRIQAPSTETAFANNTYTLDRWYLMTDGGSSDIQCSRQSGDTTSRFGMRVKQVNASAKKWAVAQIVESMNSYPLRNKAVRFQARVKSSSTPNLRMAILEWSGAVDAMGSARDLINAWANSADANPATTFFKSTSITVRANIAATATSGSFADFSVTATVGSNCNNIIVVFWTPSAIAQNVSIDFAEVGLYQGTNAKGWYPRPVAQELAMCQRYCYQMWRDNFGRLGGGSADTTSNVVIIGTFPVTMRVTPSLANSTVSNFFIGGVSLSSVNIAYTTNDLMAYNATIGSASLTVGVFYQLVSGANNQFLRFEAEL